MVKPAKLIRPSLLKYIFGDNGYTQDLIENPTIDKYENAIPALSWNKYSFNFADFLK